MLEGPGEWAVFMDPDTFGQPVIYTGAGRPPVSIHGIFTAAHAEVARGAGSVATTVPVLTLGEATLQFTPRAGDTVTVSGQPYRVADPQPDGSGLIRLILERN